ncbi:hypothetical protein BDW60DRAFT_154774 [Aspergillus nidulans var. acristatus]
MSSVFAGSTVLTQHSVGHTAFLSPSSSSRSGPGIICRAGSCRPRIVRFRPMQSPFGENFVAKSEYGFGGLAPVYRACRNHQFIAHECM